MKIDFLQGRLLRTKLLLVYGTTNAVYGTTNADAGMGIGLPSTHY